MSQRFFCSTPITGPTSGPIAGQRATLVDGEAHHLAHVMRAKVGDHVVLFDGGGAEFVARVERIAKAAVDLSIVQRRDIDRELPFTLTLAVALPKGDRQRWLVEKATELGVTRLVPLITARGVTDGRAALDRLRRAVIEASKQCGRNRLMEIAAAEKWEVLAASCREGVSERWFAHPIGDRKSPLHAPCLDRAAPVTIAVGPEGGWTDEEVQLASANGWRCVDLGPRVLRVETAAIAIAAAAIADRECRAQRQTTDAPPNSLTRPSG